MPVSYYIKCLFGLNLVDIRGRIVAAKYTFSHPKFSFVTVYFTPSSEGLFTSLICYNYCPPIDIFMTFLHSPSVVSPNVSDSLFPAIIWIYILFLSDLQSRDCSHTVLEQSLPSESQDEHIKTCSQTPFTARQRQWRAELRSVSH